MSEVITIKNAKSDLGVFLVPCLVIATLFVIGFIKTHSIYIALMLFLYILLAVFYIMSTLLFYVTISDGIFNYRTSLGKVGSFTTSDIKDILCESHTGLNPGTRFFLTIVTPERELQFNINMENFEVLAGYLLEKIEYREISDSELTPKDIEELKNYRDGIYKSKD